MNIHELIINLGYSNNDWSHHVNGNIQYCSLLKDFMKESIYV